MTQVKMLQSVDECAKRIHRELRKSMTRRSQDVYVERMLEPMAEIGTASQTLFLIFSNYMCGVKRVNVHRQYEWDRTAWKADRKIKLRIFSKKRK